MATLHSALQALGPVEFSSVPVGELKPYLLDIFSKCDTLVESVPDPPPDPAPSARSRAATVSSIASNASEMSSSSARSAPPSPEHATLQKEWGKAIKLGAKENPLGISVYKLSAKDGRGSWFARRSVHEGLGFSKWHRALLREFPQSMEVQGGPGEGNIRGIGGERRVEKKVVPGVGTMEVYHLSAQFPGPTAPRDFVTLLLTSSSALRSSATVNASAASPAPTSTRGDGVPHVPRHLVVVSKPCEHPDCAPREGYVRGHYESIECIREIPVYGAPVRRSVSALDLSTVGRAAASTTALGKEAALRSAAKSHTFPAQVDPTQEASKNDDHTVPLAASSPSGLEATSQRKRGKTISFVEPAGSKHPRGSGTAHDDGEEAPLDWERNPVEWIMITRSDPGGSVPRWMVERGTPAGIVADAVKFLNWATTLEDVPEHDGARDGDGRRPSLTDRTFSDDLQALDLNGHLVGIDGATPTEHTRPETNNAEDAAAATERGQPTTDPAGATGQPRLSPNEGRRNRAGERSGMPAADAVEQESSIGEEEDDAVVDDDDDVSSLASFATASSKSLDPDVEPDGDTSTTNDARSSHTTASAAAGDAIRGPVDPSAIDAKEIVRLTERKRKLDDKLAAARSKILGAVSSPAQLSPKRSATLAKAEERHRKETEKHEQKYRNHVHKLEAKRERERVKEEERRRKQEAKDERSRATKEKDDLKHRVERLTTDNQALTTQLGELQRQNTLLTARLGQIEPQALPEVLGTRTASTVTAATQLDELTPAVVHAPLASATTDGAPSS